MRTRDKVVASNMGDYKVEFAVLHDYCDEIRRSNPGTTCFALTKNLEDRRRKQFRKFYVCFQTLKQGFKEGFRQIIGLDGCFLKSPTKGQLLVAVSKDGNNQMFPLA